MFNISDGIYLLKYSKIYEMIYRIFNIWVLDKIKTSGTFNDDDLTQSYI